MTGLSVFVTATDTGAGKTHVACELLRQAAAGGLRCAGFKPVAAGGTQTVEGLRNADALALMAAGNVELSYEEVNPYLLHEAVAPHIAAASERVIVEPARVQQAWRAVAARSDLVVIEGAGGWLVPLDATRSFADLAADAGWPVLLVVAMRLGCLNHALLSAESIIRRAQLVGWVANCLPPRQPRLEDNIATLAQRLAAPLLGVIPPADRSFAVPPPALEIGAVLNHLK